MEFEMIIVLSLALLFFSGVIFLTMKERNKDGFLEAESPPWKRDNKQALSKEKAK
jgi:hypothetical protein